jgi:hypothetical protein
MTYVNQDEETTINSTDSGSESTSGVDQSTPEVKDTHPRI